MSHCFHIEISLDDQTLTVFRDGHPHQTFPISSGEKGMGFTEGSYRTPTGRFVIHDKIGEDEAIGTIFRARKPTGIWQENDPCAEDLVLTRIMRLDGLDPENKNTLERFIYIHGTNHEDRIGQPASHGCIRLKNADMMDLFELIPNQTEVIIHPHTQSKTKLLFIDCDSTLSAIEGIDELAGLSDPAIYAQVVELTNLAMNGDIPLKDVFKKRMDIIKPSYDMIQKVSRLYLEHIVPGVAEFIQNIQSAGWTPVILSGGFEPIIRPLADQLGIKHVEAVPLHFNDSGDYTGYGEDYPTTRNLGKNEIIREWKKALLPEKVIMIGDGVSDLETKPDVDLMIGFGGVVARDKVKAGAVLWITSFQDDILSEHLG